jgi:formylglycine-generating enzyme required for sulfatase activity
MSRVWFFIAQVALTLPVDRIAIPAGAYYRGAGNDRAAEADESPGGRITLPAFTIDRTEVTRGAYAACVLSGRCAARGDLGAADITSRLPMTNVSWQEATSYCATNQGRLPTEAEWERAARGAKDRRRYPWGDSPRCDRANYGNFEGEGSCPDNPGRPVEVGRYPAGASPDGVLDLAGNVWEWTADFYDGKTPGKQAAKVTARGKEELGRAPRRSVRGGACCSMFGLPRLSNRVGFPEDYRDIDLGFRCAGGATLVP